MKTGKIKHLSFSNDAIFMRNQHVTTKTPDHMFLRELTQNSIDAGKKLYEKSKKKTKVWWTVDETISKDLFYCTAQKLAIIDNGPGLDPELLGKRLNEYYSTGNEQGLHANFGIGAKDSANPYNPEGIVYISFRDGIGYMAYSYLDEKKGLMGMADFSSNDEEEKFYTILDKKYTPKQIVDHGFMVILLGQNKDDNTFQSLINLKGTKPLRNFLNKRFFKFPEWIDEIKCLEPDVEKKYPHRQAFGHMYFLENRNIISGKVISKNATYHWALLKSNNEEKFKKNNNDDFNCHATLAFVYQNEIYQLLDTEKSKVILRNSFGILLGANEVQIHIELNLPKNSKEIVPDETRTLLYNDKKEIIQHEDYGSYFVKNMPIEIINNMNEKKIDYDKDQQKKLDEKINALEFDGLRHYVKSKQKQPNTANNFTDENGRFKTGQSGGTGGKSGLKQKLEGWVRKIIEDDNKQIQLTSSISEGGDYAEEVIFENKPKFIWHDTDDKNEPDLVNKIARITINKKLIEIVLNHDFPMFIKIQKELEKRYDEHKEKLDFSQIIKDEIIHHAKYTLAQTIGHMLSFKNKENFNNEEYEKMSSPEALNMSYLCRDTILKDLTRVISGKFGKSNQLQESNYEEQYD